MGGRDDDGGCQVSLLETAHIVGGESLRHDEVDGHPAEESPGGKGGGGGGAKRVK